ncbi:MAG: ligand-gated channel, partial [Chlorobiales bacterium]|nr:ligand-gated channel [Chlorobiales bacterium]
RPLIEIMPLRLTTKLTSPEVAGIKFYLRHTYENAQGRIDKTLMETSTGTWNTIDLGLTGKYSDLVYSVDVENIGNLSYYRHLSYLRDPFSSGYRVYEPGANVRLNLRYYLN